MLTPAQRESRLVKMHAQDERAKKRRQVSADNPPQRVIRTMWDYQSRSPRQRVYSWIKMRATEPGIRNTEIAKRMGISPSTLNAVLCKARQEGWLRFDDPMTKLEHEIIPGVVDNLAEFVAKGDKTVTIEVAKGTIFKQYQESKGISDNPMTVLALKIEAPKPGEDDKIMTGTIVGQPRGLED